MNSLSEKFSVYVVLGMFVLTAYVFWAASDNELHFFVLKIYAMMTENWFLVFAGIGGILLYYLNTFTVIILASAGYIAFLTWPNVEQNQLLARVSDHLGDVTATSALLSDDAFRVYAMLIAIAFLDVLNLAIVRTREGKIQ